MEGKKEEDEKGVEKEAELRLPDGTTVKLPVLVDAAGQTFVDVRHLQTATGICTFDPGFSSTASCQSKITYIDGQKGVLLYRGYPIEQLAKQCSFAEVAYLLQYGELPTVERSMEFQEKLTYETMVHEHLIRFYQGFKPDAHPMAILVGVVGALSSFYENTGNIHDPLQRERACTKMIAKMPTIAAIAYKTAKGQPIMYPRNDLSLVENFLYMMVC
uniref:Citrate synthase n=1 Tax=Picocystis salinarum TaxID=88271 RepID=A0A7S3UCE3_9CHLO